jgi:hypothetical protein
MVFSFLLKGTEKSNNGHFQSVRYLPNYSTATFIKHFIPVIYSNRSDFTGFNLAALIAW